ncbi:MAG: hypothetical protein JO217_04945, partial [Acidobacteriaceae bacterium]|nr:hypothetical protein [Acidobacteriaceae bacterium]
GWLKSLCEGRSTSISDAARAAVLASAPALETSGSVEISLDKFDNKLDQILHLLRDFNQDPCKL